MISQSEIQIGKNGITENFINSLKNNFKTHINVRISVLKSSGRDREKIKEMSEQILEKLGKNYTSRIIGFTIIVKKWRKPVR
jgi:RNA-binding protein YhbY